MTVADRVHLKVIMDTQANSEDQNDTPQNVPTGL